MKSNDTHIHDQPGFRSVATEYIRNAAVLAGVVFILFALFGSEVISRVATSTITPRANLAAAATSGETRCQENADVTVGFGGLGTGVIKCLSDGVCAALQSVPNSKHYGCMIIGCRDRLGAAERYVLEQARAAGRPITVDILGHSAGADGTSHLVKRLAGNPNIRIRNIIMADPTPLASAIPAGVGQVTNLVSSWDSASCMRSASPTRYINRPDLDHLQIDNLIPQYMGCKDEKLEQQCITGNEESCRNKCSTTYLDINPTSKKISLNDCYDKNAGQEGAAKNLILKLEQCVSSAGAAASEDSLKKALCITTREVSQNGTTGDIELTQEKQEPIKIPAKCAPIVKQIENLRNGTGAQTEAQKSDVGSCTWKGAVQCFPDPSNPQGGTFRCGKKIDGPENINIDPATLPANNNDALRQCVQKKLSSPTTSILGGSPASSSPGGNQNSTTPSQNQANQCPTGYKQSQGANGKIICTQEEKKDGDTSSSATTPQCILVASKEEVSAGSMVQLQWRTANAQEVSISNIEGAQDTSGSTVVRPEKTTTYTLTATGSGDKKKTCSVDVRVIAGTETQEQTGAAPNMLCTPGLIPLGAQATVSWQCTSDATSSEGVGVLTNGRVQGSAVVEPAYNKQYEVACKQGDTTIGRNACSVRVGEPSIEMLANPMSVRDDTNIRVSWGSLFMSNCTVEGPRGFSFNKTTGIVITQPFTASIPQNVTAATYTATCTSEFGQTITEEIRVQRI